MKPEQQRIAIAKACGWRRLVLEEDDSLPGRYGMAIDQLVPPSGSVSVPLPDYLNDLNAMHEAETILMADDAMYSQRNFYAHHLGCVTLNDNGRGWQPLSNDDCFPILHANAAQRAEAFLKTLELWTE